MYVHFRTHPDRIEPCAGVIILGDVFPVMTLAIVRTVVEVRGGGKSIVVQYDMHHCHFLYFVPYRYFISIPRNRAPEEGIRRLCGWIVDAKRQDDNNSNCNISIIAREWVSRGGFRCHPGLRTEQQKSNGLLSTAGANWFAW